MANVAAMKPAGVKPLVDVGIYGSKRWILLLGFVLASVLEVLDTSIINPVLPTMAGNLGCTTTEIAWVSTAYILANVVVLPMTAWLSQRFGLKRYMLLSILLFVGASVMCGLSSSLGEIIAWRLVQGAAGAPLISMTQAALAVIFTKKEQTIAQGIWAIGIAVAPSVAPALGGWIADNYAWPWIFFINAPIGVLSMFLIAPIFRESPKVNAGKVDLFGVALLTVGLGSIQYVLEEGNREDWFQNRLILELTIIGLLSMVTFVWWELSRWNRAPIVKLRVLRDRGLSAGFVLMFVAGVGLYSGLYVFPLFGQAILGFTPTKSGVFMLVPGVFLAATMMFGGGAMEKGIPARDMILVGILTSMFAAWTMGHMTSMSNESDAQVSLIFRSVGLGLLMLPISVAAIANLKGDSVAQGSALMGLSRQLGGSIGIAVASTILTQQTQFHRVHLMGHADAGNPLLTERLNAIAMNYYIRGGMDMTRATAAARQALDGQVTRQAYTMAANNVYVIVMILFAISLPFVFMMKRAKGGGGMAAH